MEPAQSKDQPANVNAAEIVGAQPAENSASPQTTAPQTPQHVIVHHTTGSRLARWFAWFGWLGFFFCIVLLIALFNGFKDYFNTTEGIQEKFHSGEEFGDTKVAIIDISGVIMDGDGFVKKQIDRIRKDDNVKAAVIRVDSPGGTITGSDYIYHHLKKLREEEKLPLVVSMGGMAASGGYYVSMAVGDEKNTIFAEPTTTTGSIGVIIPHYDLSGLLERFDVKDDSIMSHPRKQMLSMTRPISPEDREILQSYVNESFDRFKEIVHSGRPSYEKDPAALDDLATGEIFTATQAKRVGLVDSIGFIEDAIARAIELAKLDKDDVRVVRYERPVTLLSAAGMAQSRTSGFDLQTLFELSAPRGYYLATSLPALISSRRAN